jgi:hypothetical protein
VDADELVAAASAMLSSTASSAQDTSIHMVNKLKTAATTNVIVSDITVAALHQLHILTTICARNIHLYSMLVLFVTTLHVATNGTSMIL